MPKFTQTGLETLEEGVGNWSEIMESNARILNDTLLFVSGLLDVNLTSLSERDILVYNSSTGKWENKPYESVISTTTTTSSSTTTTTTL